MDGFVVDLAIRGAIVLAATAATALATRRASAATRHLVWSVGAAALVSVPLLERVVPDLPVPLLPASSAATAPGSSTSPVASADGSWLFWIWLAGVALVGITVVVGRSRVWWLARTSHRLTGGPLRALATRLCGEIGLSRRIDVRVVDRSIMPMTWGIVRPTILLPTEIEGWPEDRRRHVMLHELAHVQRNDYAAQVVGRIACALHWFNPLAWLSVRRMRDERERACDDHVLDHGTSACDYAEDLLEVARSLRSTPVHVTAIGMAQVSSLRERLAALLDDGRRRTRLTRRSAATSALAAACVVTPLAAIQPEARPAKSIAATGEAAVVERAPGIEGDDTVAARRRVESVRRAEERLSARFRQMTTTSRSERTDGRKRMVLTMAASPIEVVVAGAGSSGDALDTPADEETCDPGHGPETDENHERRPASEPRLATSEPRLSTLGVH